MSILDIPFFSITLQKIKIEMTNSSNKDKFQSALDLCEKGEFSSAEPILRDVV